MAYYAPEMSSVMNKDLTAKFLENYSKTTPNYENYNQMNLQNLCAMNFKSTPKFQPVFNEGYNAFPTFQQEAQNSHSVVDFAGQNTVVCPKVRYNELPIPVTDKRFHKTSQAFYHGSSLEKHSNRNRKLYEERSKPYFRGESTGNHAVDMNVLHLTDASENTYSDSDCTSANQMQNSAWERPTSFNLSQENLPMQNPAAKVQTSPQILPPGYKVYNISVEKTESGYQMSAPAGLSFTEEDIATVIKVATTGETIYKPRPKSNSDEVDRPASRCSSSYSDYTLNPSSMSTGSEESLNNDAQSFPSYENLQYTSAVNQNTSDDSLPYPPQIQYLHNQNESHLVPATTLSIPAITTSPNLLFTPSVQSTTNMMSQQFSQIDNLNLKNITSIQKISMNSSNNNSEIEGKQQHEIEDNSKGKESLPMEENLPKQATTQNETIIRLAAEQCDSLDNKVIDVERSSPSEGNSPCDV